MGEFKKIMVDTNKTKLYRCKVSDSICVDEYTKLEFLNPSKNSKLSGENDNSLVVRLMYKNAKFLFAADITNVCECDMMEKQLDLRADILKVAHHGSTYSTSDEFLNKVNPSLAIISVGENNKFKHPSNNVLEKLHKKNIKVLRTDKNGQIQIITDGEKIRIRRKF